jgi:Metallo-peptidase family M12
MTAAAARGQRWTAMKALFDVAAFGLVPVPLMPACEIVGRRPGGLPMTTEDMRQAQPNGISEGKTKHETAPSQLDDNNAECTSDPTEGEVVGLAADARSVRLSQTMKSIVLVVLSGLGGFAIPAIAGIDYPIRHTVQEMHVGIVESQGHAPGPMDPHVDDRTPIPGVERSILRPVTRGMRPPTALLAQTMDLQLASAGANATAVGKTIRNEQKPEDIVIDVIVAYTKNAASGYADIKRELVDLAIEETNKSFRMSNLGHIALRLVHAYETDYVEKGEHFDHVWRFADKGDGYMEEIHTLRDLYRADIAILVMDDPKGCGLATRVRADADDAFAVVHHECAAASYTLAHEVGHLMGARHEFSYANGTQWRDIMGSIESCGGCPRMPVWSGPTVLVNGEPAGTPELNNARVIAEQAARVAAFR